MLLVLAAYLIGSIPFGYLTGRLVGGIDIRQVGSGNIGATNVGRTLGWHWFFVVLLLDFAKGCGPTLAAARWAPELTESMPWWQQPTQITVAAGVAAIVGHLWPCYLRFRGGKGVATGLGVIVALAPLVSWWPLAVATAAFALCLAVFRYISLASMVSSIAYGITHLVVAPQPWSAEHASLSFFSLLIPALVVWRHRSNLGRLLRGEEPRLGDRKKQAGEGQVADPPETAAPSESAAGSQRSPS